MRMILTTLSVFFYCNICLAQNKDSVKIYKQALAYIDNHKQEIVQKWQKAFGRDRSRRKYIKDRIGSGFEYKVSDIISYLRPAPFIDVIAADPNRIPVDPNGPPFFDPYVTSMFHALSDSTKSLNNPFFIGFSKPTQNYLVAEIVRDERRMREARPRFLSEVIRMLFVYNGENNLQKVYYKMLIID